MPRVATVLSALLASSLIGCTATQSSREGAGLTGLTGDRCRKSGDERTYVEPCVTSGSQTPDTPIRDVPGSVGVLNRELIDDQKALRIGDALRNVSGVQSGGR